ADLPGHVDVLVHRVGAPARAPPVEASHDAIRIALAVREPAAEEAVAPGDLVGGASRLAAREDRVERASKLRRHALVRVEAKHPVVRRGLDAELLLRSESGPRPLQHAGAAGTRNVYGMIGAARIDDHRLGRERRRSEAFGNVALGVARDHDHRQGKGCGHEWGPGRRAQDRAHRSDHRHAAEARAILRVPRAGRDGGGYLPRMSAAGSDAAGVLVVRPSSLGDIVYALAVATDIRRQRPELAVDWVAEPGFAPLVSMCADV